MQDRPSVRFNVKDEFPSVSLFFFAEKLGYFSTQPPPLPPRRSNVTSYVGSLFPPVTHPHPSRAPRVTAFPPTFSRILDSSPFPILGHLALHFFPRPVLPPPEGRKLPVQSAAQIFSAPRGQQDLLLPLLGWGFALSRMSLLCNLPQPLPPVRDEDLLSDFLRSFF